MSDCPSRKIIFYTEQEAKERAAELILKKQWPCYFFKSDTTGEKSFEEFYTDKEDLNLSSFNSVGVIKNSADFDDEKLNYFLQKINMMNMKGSWTKDEFVELFFYMLPNFDYIDKGKYLDQKM